MIPLDRGFFVLYIGAQGNSERDKECATLLP
jgi:hypothetical protein